MIAISGSVAQRPGRAGHAWVFLSYLLGFRALGHEVLFIDRLRPEMVEGGVPRGGWPSSPEARWLVGPDGEVRPRRFLRAAAR